MLGIEKKVARTARRAGLLTGGLLLCMVGAGFLTVAAWLALVPVVGAAMTATIIACVYLGTGAVMLGISTASRPSAAHEAQRPRHAQNTDSPPIVEAFMYGLQAGAQSRQGRS